MATIRKRETGKWQVIVRKSGHKTLSRSFKSKQDALAWSRQTESEMDRSLWKDTTAAEKTTLGALLDKYEREILPSKRSQKAIKSQITIIKRKLSSVPLSALTPALLSEYRDFRLRSVSNQTARHELSLIQRALNVAIKDWGIHLPHGNPIEQIRLPSLPQGRNRRPTSKELKTLTADSTIGQYVILAIETGMRRSEIANIEVEHYDKDRYLLTIPVTKNGRTRIVPISTGARAALRHILRRRVKPDSITQAFERACKRNGIKGLRFHDLRHEATSRLFEMGLNPIEVAAITGHQDLRMLNRYTHLSNDYLVAMLG